MATLITTLPPAPTVPPPSFERRLHTLVCSCFDEPSLATLLRLDLNIDLLTVVEPGAFETVVENFLVWATREGRLADFLNRAVFAKPKRNDLAAIRDELLAATAPPGGLPAGDVEAAVTRFGDRFRERRIWLQYLKAYKQLHDLLHDLNGYLGQLRKEQDARAATGAALSKSSDRALRKWSADAGTWWSRTEQSKDIPLWVTQFKEATELFLGADATRHSRALDRLASLPATNLLGLNAEMLKCANRLKPDELLLDLDTALRLIGPSAAAPLAAVASAVEDFRDPCTRLALAIRYDTLCQNIDTELRAAAGLPVKSKDSILGWDVISGGLSTLGEERPGDLKTAAVVAAADAFETNPSAATFDRLLEAFEVQFKAMDVQLLSVTTDLLLAASQLTDSLADRP